MRRLLGSAMAVVALIATSCDAPAEHATAPTTSTDPAPTTVTTVKPRPKPRSPKRASKPPVLQPSILKPVVGGVAAFGDSLMIGAVPSLRALVPAIDIDAAVSRSALPVPGIMRARASEGRLAPSLVLDLALNGGVTSGLVDDVLGIAAGRRVVMLTARCPYCTYTAGENAIIRAQCTSKRNCHVADWEAHANAHPDWFGSDGVHMGVGGRGAQAYAQLVRSKLTDPVRPRTPAKRQVSARPNFQ